METVKLFKRKKKKVQEPVLKDEVVTKEVQEEPKLKGSLADLEGVSLADIGGGDKSVEKEEAKVPTAEPPEIKLKTSNIPSLGGQNIGVVEEPKKEVVESVQSKVVKEKVKETKSDPESAKAAPSKPASSNIPSLGKQEEVATTEDFKESVAKEQSKPVGGLSIADLAKAEATSPKISAPVIPSTPVDTVNPNKKEEEVIKKTKKKKSVLLPIIGALISISIAVGAAYYTTSNKQDSLCTYNGGAYIDGTSFDSIDGCNICNCTDGEVICGEESCEDIEVNSTQDEVEEVVEVEYISEVEKDKLYIATLNTKHILYYLSEGCKDVDGNYTKGAYAQILDNETYFSTACVASDELVEIYEIMQLDEDYINTIRSYYYNADSNNVYISLVKSTKESDESIGIDPYIYELNLDNQTSKVLWSLDTDDEQVNTTYAYISNKSTENILMVTLLDCNDDDCIQENPDTVFVIDLTKDVVEELGQVYVQSIVDDTISYKKYDNQFYYPIGNVDAKSFYCTNNPDYWCGDAESVWELYIKIYTKIL